MEESKQEAKTIQKPAKSESKYSKDDFLRSGEYDKVLIKTILEDEKEYTKSEVNELIKKFKRGDF